MNSRLVRNLVAVLLLLVGMVSLYSSLDSGLDAPLVIFKWISIAAALLLLLGAYGLFRQFASARYAMYAYLAITSMFVGFIALQSTFLWRFVVAGGFALATTFTQGPTVKTLSGPISIRD